MSLIEHLQEFRSETPDDGGAPEPRETARQTLALRIAHRNRLRAERLARLRFPAGADAAGVDIAGAAAPGLAEAPAGAAMLAQTAPQPQADRPAEAAGGGFGLTAVEAADASDALEEFLRMLGGSLAAPVMPVDEPEPAAVLQFQRTAPDAEHEEAQPSEPLAAPVCDLDRLRGVGPGLVWALNRAGIACLADMATLEPDGLADRLGPLGRLVPVRAWIAFARDAAPGT